MSRSLPESSINIDDPLTEDQFVSRLREADWPGRVIAAPDAFKAISHFAGFERLEELGFFYYFSGRSKKIHITVEA